MYASSSVIFYCILIHRCKQQFHLTTKFIFKCKKVYYFNTFGYSNLDYFTGHSIISKVKCHYIQQLVLLRLAVMDPHHLHGTCKGSQPKHHRFLMLLTIHSRPWYNLQQRKSLSTIIHQTLVIKSLFNFEVGNTIHLHPLNLKDLCLVWRSKVEITQLLLI